MQSGFSVKKDLTYLFSLKVFGFFSALVGHFFLSKHPDLTAHLKMIASVGILYLLIQDIVAESKLEKNYLISLGASLVFLVGIVGEMLI